MNRNYRDVYTPPRARAALADPFDGDMNGGVLINLADPVALTDAVNKQTVDTYIYNLGTSVEQGLEKIVEDTNTAIGTVKTELETEMGVAIETVRTELETELETGINTVRTELGTEMGVEIGSAVDNVRTELITYIDGHIGESGGFVGDMLGKRITHLADPVEPTDAVNKKSLQESIEGIDYTDMKGNRITHVADPFDPTDAVNQQSLDKQMNLVYIVLGVLGAVLLAVIIFLIVLAQRLK